MKSTGIVRHLDELGRIVLPMEIRNTLDIGPKDKLEIFVEGEKIILKKYAPSCTFCGSTKNNIILNNKRVCKDCLAKLNEQNQ
jgi:transcriptional pleiotropic regulator of transition state genes